MCPNPGFVLHSTKLLEEFAARRVMETAQFVFAVKDDDWFVPGSRGLRSIEMVRLMHAGMRLALLEDKRQEREWDMKSGIPINQQDVALTNHLFSLAIIQGLDSVGVHLSTNERHAVFHMWQKIGQAMGIHEDMFCKTYAEGWPQYKTIMKRQVNTVNSSGPPLTNALLMAMNQITDTAIPIKALEDFTRYAIHDKKSAQSLGIHEPSLFDKLLNSVLHYILSSRVWHFLNPHRGRGVFRKLLKKIGDYILIKKFNLGPYLEKYPDATPLEAFTKVMLLSLSGRDMQTFDTMSTATRNKTFFMNDKLFDEWDLGSFELNVEVED